jgi:protocatechuate 3,4-dioxygenase beta subunit
MIAAKETGMDDDRRQGPLLGRRTALRCIAATAILGSAAHAAGAADTTVCVARPEQTEGPFFVDERLERGDIRGDPATGAVSPGTPLALVLAVGTLRGSACTPLPAAVVDVWQCDAAGRYSDVRDGAGSTVGQRFLRGFQRTDLRGEVRFVTIVPGWYAGRAVHIHFRIASPSAGGRNAVFTSQLYFDEAFIDRVHAGRAYQRAGGSRLPNASDGLYRRGGSQLLLSPQAEGDGYAARFVVGLTA